MTTSFKRPLFLLTILACLCACGPKQPIKAAPKKPTMMGNWEVQEIHWVSPDKTRSIVPAQTGLFLLNEKRYAIMWTPTATPRTPFGVLASPTDEELKAGFNSVAFNAGTYELTDSILTTTASIAKVPGFEGGRQFFWYHIDHSTLTLVMFDEIYPNGTKPAWSGKLEVKLVLKRVE